MLPSICCCDAGFTWHFLYCCQTAGGFSGQVASTVRVDFSRSQTHPPQSLPWHLVCLNNSKDCLSVLNGKKEFSDSSRCVYCAALTRVILLIFAFLCFVGSNLLFVWDLLTWNRQKTNCGVFACKTVNRVVSFVFDYLQRWRASFDPAFSQLIFPHIFELF